MDAMNEGSDAPGTIGEAAERGTVEANGSRQITGVPAGSVIVNVLGDGSCMFHAAFVCYFFAHKGKVIWPFRVASRIAEASRKLREATVNYVVRHYRKPLGGVKGNSTGRDLILLEYGAEDDAEDACGAKRRVPGPKVTIKGPKTYAEYMKSPRTYAGETELHGLSGLLRVGIVVHPTNDKGRGGLYYNVLDGPNVVEGRDNPNNRIVLHLAYDPEAQHYGALLPLSRTGTAAA